MASNCNLGRMEMVDLRTVWQNEAGHFTPWLAEEINLALLADTLGMDLQLESQETGIGAFRADIVCKDAADGTLVVVENQLERTDHSHLGQILTYAAGVNAATIVWIAERFTEEHRAALDWLNENTGENISFFGLEIELWRINGSPVAPKFNIVSKPNDWTKGNVSKAGASSVVTETQLLQQEYWHGLRELLAARKSHLKPQKARPQHWLNFSIGRSHMHLSAVVNTLTQRIGVSLYLSGAEAKAWFKSLEAQKTQIEKELGAALDWQELPGRASSRILMPRDSSNIEDRSQWPLQHAWLADTLERMSSVFRPRVTALTSPDSDAET